MTSVVVALIALTGALVPTFVAAGQGGRERRALREEVELLEALPSDMRSRLQKHVELRLNQYLTAEALRPERRSTLWFTVSVAVTTTLAVVSFGYINAWSLLPHLGLPRAGLTVLGFLMILPMSASSFAVGLHGNRRARFRVRRTSR